MKTIAKMSLLEFSREKFVWICLFVGVALFGFSLVLGALSFDEKQRILAHFGFMAIQLSSLGIAWFLSANWLHKEMDRQTCLLVLARPISREKFILGKFLAVMLFIFFIQLILGIFLYCLLGFGFPLSNFIAVLYGTFLEVVIVSSVCFFAATFMQPAVSFFCGVSVFLAGHWVQDVIFFGRKIHDSFFSNLGKLVQWFCPNLFEMNWRSVYFLQDGVAGNRIVWVSVHAWAWIALFLICSMLVFRRKDLV